MVVQKCGCNFCNTNPFFCNRDFDLSAQRAPIRQFHWKRDCNKSTICHLKCKKVDTLMWFVANQVKVKAKISIIIYSNSQCDKEKIGSSLWRIHSSKSLFRFWFSWICVVIRTSILAIKDQETVGEHSCRCICIKECETNRIYRRKIPNKSLFNE